MLKTRLDSQRAADQREASGGEAADAGGPAQQRAGLLVAEFGLHQLGLQV